jgi:hypothetical protein
MLVARYHVFMQNTYPPFAQVYSGLALVTVSIAADTIGTLSVIFLENFDLILTCGEAH